MQVPASHPVVPVSQICKKPENNKTNNFQHERPGPQFTLITFGIRGSPPASTAPLDFFIDSKTSPRNFVNFHTEQILAGWDHEMTMFTKIQEICKH